MPDLVPVRRALLSVSDKTGLAEFASALQKEFGVELISTGGTATFLRQQGLPVTDVAQVTGFPEMMDGRVKTLHPKIHGGLLALRNNPEHAAAMAAHDIKPIDLLCINLYPFAKTIENPSVTLEEAIENIDIGGPAMIRSASKNHDYVMVVTSPNRYEKILGDLRKHSGSTCHKMRLKQAQSAFAHTAQYDGLIAKYLAKQITPEVEAERQEQPVGGPAWHMDGPRGGAVAIAAAIQSPDQNKTPPPNLESAIKSASYARSMADTASTAKEFFDAMIKLQIAEIQGSEGCVFTVGSDRKLSLGGFVRSPQFVYLAKESDTESLVGIAEQVVKFKEDVVVQMDASFPVDIKQPIFAIITLLRYAGKTDAVSMILSPCDDKQIANDRLMAAQIIAGEYGRFAYRQSTQFIGGDVALPLTLSLPLTQKQSLRYGENPHQKAALYIDRQPAEASVAYAKQLHGKELSYINLLDADGALSAVKEFSDPAACIVKHTTPCGCATAADLPTAFRRAFEGDPLAAFGGIVALNKTIDLATAQAITSIDKLLEVIVAPAYADDALALLRERWKNVRLLEVGPVDKFDSAEFHLHKIVGGYLVQQRDLTGLNETDWKIASTRPPTEKELADLRFAWLVCKHVKSNAIVVAKDRMLLGAGAGQMDRPCAARLAISKAGDRIAHSVAASDAFFPFPDGPKLLLDAGVTAIIHPGGSLKDQDTIDLVNARGAALVLTGQRHFKH